MRRPSFRVALSFLTRIPVGAAAYDADAVGRSASWFPVVGAGLGLGAVGVLKLGLVYWPAPVAAMVAVTLWIAATGGLHQDALADTLDGFGGAFERQRVLEIMRDSRVGVYGALGLILAVGLRWTALVGYAGHASMIGWVVTAGATSRWCSLCVGWWLPYARGPGQGLGRAVSDGVGRWTVFFATAVTLCIGGALLGGLVLVSMGVGLLVAAAMGAWMKRRIGGATGDTLGAVTEVAEVVILMVGLLGSGPW